MNAMNTSAYIDGTGTRLSPPWMPEHLRSLPEDWEEHLQQIWSLADLVEEPRMTGNDFMLMFQEADKQAGEFLEQREHDPEADDIPALDQIHPFMSAVALASLKAGVPLPYLFEGDNGRLLLRWIREEDDRYLYARLDSKTAKWIETEEGEHKDTEILNLECGSADWEILTDKLRKACAA